jgi:osmotically-inducible protein OsmY
MNYSNESKKGECIMLKSSRIMGFMASLALIGALTGCAATPKHESTGEYVDDSVITTKVKAAIFSESSLKTLQINVKTYQGTVQLSGFVDSAQSVEKAGEVARNVKSVTTVKNDLLVK